LVGGAPYAIVAAILGAYPDSAFAKESSYKRLPLHCACRKNALLQVAELLLKSHSEAALIADNLGRLPSKYTYVLYCIVCLYASVFSMLVEL
jgi:hypothetical protein